MATTPPTQNLPLAASRPAWLVTLLCWLIVVFDGYDLIVYGTTLPSLLKEKGCDLTPTSAGFIGSLAFAGMLVGALAAGLLSDRLGRRRTILWATLWFSAFNALCAEFVSRKHRSAISTMMMSGVPIGGSIAALLGLWLLPTFGWRSMYAV